MELNDDKRTKVIGSMRLVFIPGGSFQMGSEEGENEEKPIHDVSVNSFWLGETVVTNFQYCVFLNTLKPTEATRRKWVVIRNDLENVEYAHWFPTEIWFQKGQYKPTPGYEDHPVVSVSWFGAEEFCKHYGLRLPTEAEWEYAAGGPEHTKYPWGKVMDENLTCFNQRWEKNTEKQPTVAVKSYPANGYGLYDMAGNINEWCDSWYDAYPGCAKNEDMGEKNRIVKGGGWGDDAEYLRCAARGYNDPECLSYFFGFRVAGNL